MHKLTATLPVDYLLVRFGENWPRATGMMSRHSYLPGVQPRKESGRQDYSEFAAISGLAGYIDVAAMGNGNGTHQA